MKTRLPKALLTALLIVLATTAQATDYNVGVHTGKNNLPSSASNYWTHTENDLTLTGTDRLGYISGDTLVTGLGKEQWSLTGKTSSGTVTRNVKINGTLTIEDDAQVVLFTGAKEDTYSGYKVALLDEEGNSTGTAVLEYNEDGTVTLGVAAVPEPTTATLSLLALAALAARRRK